MCLGESAGQNGGRKRESVRGAAGSNAIRGCREAVRFGKHVFDEGVGDVGNAFYGTVRNGALGKAGLGQVHNAALCDLDGSRPGGF